MSDEVIQVADQPDAVVEAAAPETVSRPKIPAGVTIHRRSVVDDQGKRVEMPECDQPHQVRREE